MYIIAIYVMYEYDIMYNNITVCGEIQRGPGYPTETCKWILLLYCLYLFTAARITVIRQ